ncbi:hypothetical protein [Bacillus sp. ISL-55]|uniref:hypothetical protein n=1 Tax=Bacillus sp. ISL-55 TaxID=2819134 RepID=UPI001BE7AAC2|nr:hypothetical protein [Bacillus sp. ISL-55]MBT2691614.1 hypothetical protein [Bacillus sp. ISL-55]
MKSKKITYIMIALIALLFFINIYQYNRITEFESQLGSNFQQTVRDSLFILEHDGDPNIWIKILKEEEGEITLASHIGEITRLSRQYYMMNGKISVIGDILNSLADDYYQLAVSVKKDSDYAQTQEEINLKIDFLITLLNKADSISGENEKQYYKEFTDSESKTSNLIWREYKKYEKK